MTAPICTGALPSTITRTTWASRSAVHGGRVESHTWPELLALLRRRAATIGAKQTAPAVGWYETCDGHRHDESVTVHALGLDCDGGGQPMDVALQWLREQGLAGVVHETPRATLDAPRWRVVLPLAMPWTDPTTWKEAYDRLRDLAQTGMGVAFDASCKNPSRFFYDPFRLDESDPPRRVEWVPGAALDLPATIVELPRPTPEPRCAPQHTAIPRDGRHRSALADGCLRVARDAIASAIDGEGNATVNAQGYDLGRLAGGGLITEHEAMRAIEDGLAGWTWRTSGDRARMIRTAERAIRQGMDDPKLPKEREPTMHTPDPRKPPTQADSAHDEPHEEGDVPPDREPVPNRPMVYLDFDEMKANDAAIAALAIGDTDVYQRTERLVTILHAAKKDHISRAIVTDDTRKNRESPKTRIPTGMPLIRSLSLASVRERLSSVATYYIVAKGDDGQPEQRPKRIPDWMPKGVHDRGEWAGIRMLRGVVNYPVMAPDGRIVATPGYDAQTGFYLCNLPEIVVPEKPTQDDARRAAQDLLEVIRDFPCVDDVTKSIWLSGILTLLARPAIDGVVPVVFIDANSAGAGKTLFADTIGVLVTGREVPKQNLPKGRDSDTELEKIFISLARLALPTVCFDNIESSLGGPVWNRWATAVNPSGRTLGQSEAIVYDWLTQVIVTANNGRARDEADRRMLFASLVTDLEHPESRDPSSFHWHPILDRIRQERPRLLSDALTILRAHQRSSRLPIGRAKGTYEAWGVIVRDAIMFAGLPDCERGVEDLVKPVDETNEARRRLIASLRSEFGLARQFTTREIIDKAFPPESCFERPNPDLRDALDALHARPTGSSVGQIVGACSRKWYDGVKLLQRRDKSNTACWYLVSRNEKDNDNNTSESPKPPQCSSVNTGVAECCPVTTMPESPESFWQNGSLTQGKIITATLYGIYPGADRQKGQNFPDPPVLPEIIDEFKSPSSEQLSYVLESLENSAKNTPALLVASIRRLGGEVKLVAGQIVHAAPPDRAREVQKLVAELRMWPLEKIKEALE